MPKERGNLPLLQICQKPFKITKELNLVQFPLPFLEKVKRNKRMQGMAGCDGNKYSQIAQF